MPDRLAPGDTSKDVFFFCGAIRRNEHLQRLANGFPSRIPEDALNAGIPAEDDAT